MRVSHVITRLIVGGAQENTISSVLGLRRKPEMEVELISGPTAGREGSLEPAVAAIPGMLTILPELVRPVHPWKDWRAYQKLIEHFRRTRPEIVHTHSGKAGFLGRLAAARAAVPIIVHTIHGPSFGTFQGVLANRIFRAAERRAGRVTDHFVVVAHAMTQRYLEAGIGRPELYSRVFSGFELTPYLRVVRDSTLAAQYGINDGDFVVGKIARLFTLKGHDDLFRAAPSLIRQCPHIKFLLVGDGPWRGRFEAMAQTPELAERFIFTGLVPPTEIPRYLSLMDILVHLSRREGLPRALPQALAVRRPVVAYDCDGAGEVCREGVTGYLIRPGDQATLVQRIVKLSRDAELRRRLGEAGRQFVTERFSVERMVDDLEALYHRLITARPGDKREIAQ